MREFDQSKLFFIIAPDRSGTTMLQEIMNTFSNFCNLKESRIAGPESPSCWHYVNKHNDFSYLEKFIEENWTNEFFIEKSPPSIMCLPQISRKYPKANIIFLKRNPFKIVLSQLNGLDGISEIGTRRTDLGNILLREDSITAIREQVLARRLLKMIKKQISYKPNFSKSLELKYEDLVNSLDEQINLLKDYFGIESNPKKAHEQLRQPSSSTTFRYGIKELSDKVSIDIIKLACKLWGYEWNFNFINKPDNHVYSKVD